MAPKGISNRLDALDLALFAVVALQVWLCPFTKVEESFNLQAVHDILYHGPDLTKYDHFEFPGVVPRTFIGALAVAALSKPFQLASEALSYNKLTSLYIARMCLGALLVFAFGLFRRAVAKKFGSQVATFLVVVQLVQFHINFYMSRTLPNTFALFLVLIAYYAWLDDKPKLLFGVLTTTCVVFRSEVVALYAPIALEALLSRRISFPRAFVVGAVSGVLSLLVTIVVDSVMWGRLLWPEGEVLYYNTYLNKSKDWGVSPFYWYFLVAVPKTMMTTLLFVPVGLFYERRLFSFVIPATCFVFLYSFLPHKELRFIFYVFPIFNLAAACGIVRLMHTVAKKTKFAIVAVLIILVATLVLSQGFLYVSYHNYPGGVAFKRFHELVGPEQSVTVHIDVPAAQTGVSRFGQLRDGESSWIYDKTEGLHTFDEFSHVITANASIATKYAKFEQLDVVSSFAGIKRIGGFPFIEVVFKEAIYIHKRV